VFICFEGIDGAGKTTQARMLFQALKDKGYRAELVADPGTTQIGTAIRQILLNNDGPITPLAQMLLFSAARAELAAYMHKKLHDHIIICDRWLLSTLVYQGVLNKINRGLIVNIFDSTTGIEPNICFLLDISPSDAKKRMGPPRDRYERRCMADRKKMRAAYLSLAGEDYADVTHVINATAPPQTTHQRILKIVSAASDGFRAYTPKRTESKNARNGSTRVRRSKSRA
jgi:dTMP kinase